MMKVFWNCHIIIEKGTRIHNKLCTPRPLLLKACPVWISFGNRTSYPTFKGPDLPSRLKEKKPSPQRQQPHTPVKRTRGKLSICLWHSGRHAPGCPGAQFAFKNSMIRWFCNSHYVSQLAAFFIDARAKRSTVKSCQMFFSFGSSLPNTQLRIIRKETSFVSITWFTLGHLWFVGTHALLNKEKRHAYTCPFESSVTLPPKREWQTRKRQDFALKD